MRTYPRKAGVDQCTQTKNEDMPTKKSEANVQTSEIRETLADIDVHEDAKPDDRCSAPDQSIELVRSRIIKSG